MSNVIIEGPDGTGKSTLARFLGHQLRMNIQESEGAPVTVDELTDRVGRYNLFTNTIFVRHPLISNPIYDQLRMLGDKQTVGTPKLPLPRAITIYARPRDTVLPHNHLPNQHDSDVHLSLIDRYYPQLCAMYDKWGKAYADLHYVIGDNVNRIANTIRAMSFDPVADVAEFHKKFDIEYKGPPRFLPDDLSDFRSDFLSEELREYNDHHLGAWTLSRPGNSPEIVEEALENQLDALCDLMYVALGNSHLQGFDFREAWRRVHAANMTKVRAQSAADSKRGSAFDVIKPPGFVPPSHIDLVKDHAHRSVDNQKMGAGS